MKPKYRTIRRILPAAVTIALSLPATTQADIFNVGDAGNGTPSSLNSGANTIRADGGVLPLNPNPFIDILAGVSMTGDAAETEVLEITAANYSVTVASLGSLAGTNHHGITSTQAFTLSNSGTISGGTSGGKRGIFSTLATITNNVGGVITGTDDGIHFTANGGSITNYGTISGTTGGVSDGIRGRDNLMVSNMNGGLITGVQYGIYAGANVTVTNENGATISATNEDAVHFTGNGGLVTNNGTITATGGASSDGIRGRDGLTVNNNTNFNIYSNPVSGGSITGSQYGVYADDNLTLNNQELATITGGVSGINANNGAVITNDGTITGNGGNGVNAQDNGSVTNYIGATITGSVTGVWLDDTATVFNHGTITGATSGLRISDNSVVTNTGLISGGLGIDAFAGSTATFTLHNTGTITGTGGEAINGVLGADTLNLNARSIINGDINLESGDDSVNMTASGTYSSIVNGDIDGGSGTDVLTFTGGKTVAGGVTNIVHGDVTYMQDIIKNGTGTAFIGDVGSFRNVETDAIHINSGGLYINGDVDGALVSQTVITNAGGQVGGIGTWDANITLTNGAVISPGQTALGIASNVAHSVGALTAFTVTGDVTLDSSSDYVWNATPGGASDRINLTGAGNVFTTNNSDFVISPTNVNSPLLDGSTIVVDTQDTLVGSFDSISVASFPSTTPDTGLFQANQNNPIIAEYFTTLNKVSSSQDWELTIAHDYSMFGSTDNEVAAGEMLNELVNTTGDSDVADLLAAMDYSDESVTEGVLAALDPGAYMATAAALATNNYHLHRTVENHNAAVRAGSFAAVAPQAPSAKGEAPAPMMTSGCTGSSNVWGSFSYDWQDLETSNGAFDQDGDVYSFTAGIDFTVAENFRLGLVAEGSQSDMDGDYNLGSEVESYRFAAYANWGSATGWFVDALLGYNTHSVDQSRSTFMALAATESASYDADGWQGLINAGYAFETSAGTFSPYVGLEWQQLSVDSFDTEDGPLPISVGGYDVDSFRALAGVRWEAVLTESVKGYASATYAFEFEDDAADTTVEFGDGSYRASGMELGDAVLLSAGIRWGVATCTTLDVGYRGEFAMDDGIDSNGANIGLNYSF